MNEAKEIVSRAREADGSYWALETKGSEQACRKDEATELEERGRARAGRKMNGKTGDGTEESGRRERDVIDL